jgi:hypothetical protein
MCILCAGFWPPPPTFSAHLPSLRWPLASSCILKPAARCRRCRVRRWRRCLCRQAGSGRGTGASSAAHSLQQVQLRALRPPAPPLLPALSPPTLAPAVLAATALTGLVQAVAGGQPLLIVGVAEPIVLVYKFMYAFAKDKEGAYSTSCCRGGRCKGGRGVAVG